MYFRPARNGLELFVRLTPRGGEDAVEGVETSSDGRSHLKARVRAAPEKGAANAALEKFLADKLDLSRRSVSIVAGETARLKTVRLIGDADVIADRLDALTAKP